MYRHTYKVGLKKLTAVIESNMRHIQSKLVRFFSLSLSLGHRWITQVSVYIALVLVKVNWTTSASIDRIRLSLSVSSLDVIYANLFRNLTIDQSRYIDT